MVMTDDGADVEDDDDSVVDKVPNVDTLLFKSM